jgi:hypothetical protein
MGHEKRASKEQAPIGEGARQPGPLPNWTAIFTIHDRLTPPGYAETVIDMQDNPSEQERQRRRDRSSGRPAHWTSLKHGAD